MAGGCQLCRRHGGSCHTTRCQGRCTAAACNDTSYSSQDQQGCGAQQRRLWQQLEPEGHEQRAEDVPLLPYRVSMGCAGSKHALLLTACRPSNAILYV
jgi:hypothetical protein